MKKNKKLFVSIAAAATLLVTAPGISKTEAAEPVKVQINAYAYKINNVNDINSIFNQLNCQTNQLTQKQVNDIISKFYQNLGNTQYKVQTPVTPKVVQQPKQTAVQQPVKQTQQAKPTPQQPAKIEQPAKPATQQPTNTQQQAKPTTQQTTPTTTSVSSAVSAYEQQVVDLTNKERAKAGLKPLQLDVALSKVAREKSRDMQAKNYFSHTSPTYGSPFDMMKQFGITYKTAGENIAMGQRSPEEVVNAWMNSEGHRKNILNPNFTHIGVGHVANGNYWTQMFIGK
ncbi:CAP domain-containing protein [Calidifontibacillus erzurumensis]|uniref:Sporulation protein n=1 Tax=Calidifontibacillus erzurumensis TaxID=2741433 RepID=A0A8J8GIT8_9BACI|nr:CAP domain-containing protein [Calidifontibacillus erzurumensis]NSL53148.1 sporulation protein [Calidifontibacillus erzurumensis]